MFSQARLSEVKALCNTIGFVACIYQLFAVRIKSGGIVLNFFFHVS